MATLLIGMDKAPKNLFTPRHDNANVIGELNRHDDTLVSQYSIWAITENPLMGVRNLRISLKDIESMPPNVRAWIYRLISFDPNTAKEHLTYIVLGSEDKSEEAREGLAIGIRNVYFDGLEETTFPWLPDEPNVTIRHRLLEHMAACADRCPSYITPVTEAYRDGGGLLRARLEAAAQRTTLYGTLRRLAISKEQADLGLVTPPGVNITMVKQSINTGGGSIGIVGGEGTVIAQSVQAVSSMATNPGLKDALERVLQFVDKSVAKPEEKRAGAELVKTAAAEPSKPMVQKLVGWLKGLKEGTAYAKDAAQSADELIQKLDQLVGAMQ